MKRILLFILTVIILGACNNRKEEQPVAIEQPQFVSYETDLFSISYPSGYYINEVSPKENSHILFIGTDSLDRDMTTIIWNAPNTFPNTVKEFTTLFTYKEMEEYKKNQSFYEVMNIDSTYTIDQHPTYSTTSVFTEGSDTIIQSRTGMIIPQKCDMMVIQRVNTKKSINEVQLLASIINSIKIKE